jgi:hypothetical protein
MEVIIVAAALAQTNYVAPPDTGCIYNCDKTCKCNGHDHSGSENDNTRSGFYGPHCTTAGHPLSGDTSIARNRPPHFEKRADDDRLLARHRCYVNWNSTCNDSENTFSLYLEDENDVYSDTNGGGRLSYEACKGTEQTKSNEARWSISNNPNIEYRAFWNSGTGPDSQNGWTKEQAESECVKAGGTLATTGTYGQFQDNIQKWAETTRLWRRYRDPKERKKYDENRDNTFYRVINPPNSQCVRFGSRTKADADQWPNEEGLGFWSMDKTPALCDAVHIFAICERDANWVPDHEKNIEYKWFVDQANFPDATKFCKALGGDLVDLMRFSKEYSSIMQLKFPQNLETNINAAQTEHANNRQQVYHIKRNAKFDLTFWMRNSAGQTNDFNARVRPVYLAAGRPGNEKTQNTGTDDDDNELHEVLCERHICSDGVTAHKVGTVRTAKCKTIESIGPFKPTDWKESDLNFIKYQSQQVTETSVCKVFTKPIFVEDVVDVCSSSSEYKRGEGKTTAPTVNACAAYCADYNKIEASSVFGKILYMEVGLDCDTPIKSRKKLSATDDFVNTCSCACHTNQNNCVIGELFTVYYIGNHPTEAQFIPTTHASCDTYLGPPGCRTYDATLTAANYHAFTNFNLITCIPDNAFLDHPQQIEINNMLNLRTIGKNAFKNARVTINLDNAQKLETIDDFAMYWGKDEAQNMQIQMSGKFPVLAKLGEEVFGAAVGEVSIKCTGANAQVDTKWKNVCEKGGFPGSFCNNINVNEEDCAEWEDPCFPEFTYQYPDHWEPEQSGVTIKTVQGQGTDTSKENCEAYATQMNLVFVPLLDTAPIASASKGCSIVRENSKEVVKWINNGRLSCGMSNLCLIFPEKFDKNFKTCAGTNVLLGRIKTCNTPGCFGEFQCTENELPKQDQGPCGCRGYGQSEIFTYNTYQSMRLFGTALQVRTEKCIHDQTFNGYKCSQFWFYRCPNLIFTAMEEIGREAFAFSNIQVDLTHSTTSLKVIESKAFYGMGGLLQMNGAYSNLQKFGTDAMAQMNTNMVAIACVHQQLAETNTQLPLANVHLDTACTLITTATTKTDAPTTTAVEGATDAPTDVPVTEAPTTTPVEGATDAPTDVPVTEAPTTTPVEGATDAPTDVPVTEAPTTTAVEGATDAPTDVPVTEAPTTTPVEGATDAPTDVPVTEAPTYAPTDAPTPQKPSTAPTDAPTDAPTPQKPSTATGGGGGGGGGGSSGNGGAIGGAIGGVLLLGAIGVGLVKTGVVGGAASAATSAATAAPAESDSLLGMIF